MCDCACECCKIQNIVWLVFLWCFFVCVFWFVISCACVIKYRLCNWCDCCDWEGLSRRSNSCFVLICGNFVGCVWVGWLLIFVAFFVFTVFHFYVFFFFRFVFMFFLVWLWQVLFLWQTMRGVEMRCKNKGENFLNDRNWKWNKKKRERERDSHSAARNQNEMSETKTTTHQRKQSIDVYFVVFLFLFLDYIWCLVFDIVVIIFFVLDYIFSCVDLCNNIVISYDCVQFSMRLSVIERDEQFVLRFDLWCLCVNWYEYDECFAEGYGDTVAMLVQPLRLENMRWEKRRRQETKKMEMQIKIRNEAKNKATTKRRQNREKYREIKTKAPHKNTTTYQTQQWNLVSIWCVLSNEVRACSNS